MAGETAMKAYLAFAERPVRHAKFTEAEIGPLMRALGRPCHAMLGSTHVIAFGFWSDEDAEGSLARLLPAIPSDTRLFVCALTRDLAGFSGAAQRDFLSWFRQGPPDRRQPSGR